MTTHFSMSHLREVLDQGANINATNFTGETPLTSAIRHGPMETVMDTTNLLLGRGANPNATGQDVSLNETRQGMFPISVALSHGYRDVVDLLQRHGADPKTRDDVGETLLHAAST